MGASGAKASPIIGFEKEIENIQAVIEELKTGQRSNIAIIGEQFAGKTTLINEMRTDRGIHPIKLWNW